MAKIPFAFAPGSKPGLTGPHLFCCCHHQQSALADRCATSPSGDCHTFSSSVSLDLGRCWTPLPKNPSALCCPFDSGIVGSKLSSAFFLPPRPCPSSLHLLHVSPYLFSLISLPCSFFFSLLSNSTSYCTSQKVYM